MSASEVIKSIHALAVLRHLDADASQIGVIVKPLRADCYGATETRPLSSGEELAEVCHWEAQVRLRGGDWGCFTGTGATPGAALRSLLKLYEEAHEAVDVRRAGVLERRKAAMATCGQQQGVSQGSSDTPPTTSPRALSAQERAGLRIGQADLLNELMEQAQHHFSGGQTWEMLTAKRRELGLPEFALASKKAPTK